MNFESFLQCQPWLVSLDRILLRTKEKVFEGFCCFFCQLSRKYLVFGLTSETCITDQTQFVRFLGKQKILVFPVLKHFIEFLIS
jgi:hypothetical protein